MDKYKPFHALSLGCELSVHQPVYVYHHTSKWIYWHVKYLICCYKCYWRDIKLAALSTVRKGTHITKINNTSSSYLFNCSIDGGYIINNTQSILIEIPQPSVVFTSQYMWCVQCLCNTSIVHDHIPLQYHKWPQEDDPGVMLDKMTMLTLTRYLWSYSWFCIFPLLV